MSGYTVRPHDLHELAARLHRIHNELRNVDDASDFSVETFGDVRITDRLAKFARAWGDGRKRILGGIDDLADRIDGAAQSYLEAEHMHESWFKGILPGGPALARSVVDKRAERLDTDVGIAQRRVRAEKDRIKAEIAALTGGPILFDASGRTRLAALHRQLELLDEISNDSTMLLKFDLSGNGHLIAVHGDLARAKKVVVMVPGVSTDLGDYEPGHGGHRNAKQLLKEFRNQHYGDDVAVITWFDYDSPDQYWEMGLDARARAGGDQLRGFVSDLHERGFATDDITVVGHSYGSLVAGEAMKGNLDVGRVVALGSPGMGADSRADLGSPNVELYAGAASDDFVATFEHFGGDPYDRDFGATEFDVDTNGHSNYFTPGSLSLENVVRISTGRPPRPHDLILPQAAAQ